MSEAPPPFNPSQNVNSIELTSAKDSKIISVSVYNGRAEVTRLFKFNVKTGQNQLNIVALPAVLDQESLRVEGRGAATIHDVTITNVVPPPPPDTSTALAALYSKRKRLQKGLERCKRSLTSLETYLESVHAEHLNVANLKAVVESYESTGEELDNKVGQLEEQLKVVDEEIAAEKKHLAGSKGNFDEKLNVKASIGVFADFEGEIKIALIYAVTNASWNAGYDIRVDMQAKEKAISLVYKGAITQNTGEDWDDVPLTLETAAPTFGLGVPSLSPWTVSVYRPPIYKKSKSSGRFADQQQPFAGGAAPVMANAFRRTLRVAESESDEEMDHRGLNVSSRGNVTATFGVPGLISIPSDGVAHSVTIVRLSLDATLSWVSVPKKDTKTHLKAKIKNASEYTLLSGIASVYVDGSFIAKSEIPLVSPDESFDCPLGLDPSIRITYHPRNKKVSQSGFYSKTTNHVFSQRITIFNTKSVAIDQLKILDQIPVSEDSTITVKVTSPALTIPGEGSISGDLKPPPYVRVGQGVVAQWDGIEEITNGEGNPADLEMLGKDGKLYWRCAIPAQGKIGLLLQWEVTAPARTDIAGM